MSGVKEKVTTEEVNMGRPEAGRYISICVCLHVCVHTSTVCATANSSVMCVEDIAWVLVLQ